MTLEISIVKVSATSYPNQLMRFGEIDSNYIIGENAALPKYEDLRMNAQKISVIRDSLDVEKIRMDFALPDATGIIELRGLKRIAVFGKLGELLKEITLSLRALKEKYMLSVTETAYAYYSVTLANWVDNYDIQEWFSERLNAGIEDAGFYHVPISVIQDFNSTFAQEGVSIPEEDGILYQEWYRD